MILNIKFSPISTPGPTVHSGPIWRSFGNTTSSGQNFKMIQPTLMIETFLESLKPMETFCLKISKIGQ